MHYQINHMLVLIIFFFTINCVAQTQPVENEVTRLPTNILTLPSDYETQEEIADNLYLVTNTKISLRFSTAGKRYGLVDSVGHIILPCAFGDIIYINNDLIYAQVNGLLYNIYDNRGNLIKKTDFVLRQRRKISKVSSYLVFKPFEQQLAEMNLAGDFISEFKSYSDLTDLKMYYDSFAGKNAREKFPTVMSEKKVKFTFSSDYYRATFKILSDTKGERIITFKQGKEETFEIKQEFSYHIIDAKIKAHFWKTFCFIYSKPIENINTPSAQFEKLVKNVVFFENELIDFSFNTYGGQFETREPNWYFEKFPILTNQRQKLADRFAGIEKEISIAMTLFSDTRLKLMPKVHIYRETGDLNFNFGYNAKNPYIGKVILTEKGWHIKPSSPIVASDTPQDEDILLFKNIPLLNKEGNIVKKDLIFLNGFHPNRSPSAGFHFKYVAP